MNNKNIGIKAIASYIGENCIDNLGRAAIYGKTPGFIQNKIGFTVLARKFPDQETSDLCLAAFSKLAEIHTINKESIDCLIVCTQNPDGHGLPHTSAIVHEKLGLSERVAAFDISLGCSGYVYSLAIAKAFMESQGLENGLLFTADPYSKILDPDDPNTELLFGDGAAVTLLSTDPVYQIGQGLFGTDGAGWRALNVQTVDNKLHMSGREVFMFTMKVVPQQIREYLKNQKLGVEDIDLFLLHQGSRFIVEKMTEELGIPIERVPFSAREIGNTVSSTIPIMLEQYMMPPRDRILISGFGVGLSWATLQLTKA
jgi:3-oxoacyl-[acyl-carrier-protein] synthase-3